MEVLFDLTDAELAEFGISLGARKRIKSFLRPSIPNSSPNTVHMTPTQMEKLRNRALQPATRSLSLTPDQIEELRKGSPADPPSVSLTQEQLSTLLAESLQISAEMDALTSVASKAGTEPSAGKTSTRLPQRTVPTKLNFDDPRPASGSIRAPSAGPRRKTSASVRSAATSKSTPPRRALQASSSSGIKRPSRIPTPASSPFT